MAQLLIIDVQTNYAEWIITNDLFNKIPEAAKSYSSVIYLWDNVSGEELEDQFPEEWESTYYLDENDEEIEEKGFREKINKIINKQYAFIRDLMDYGIDEEDLVKLGKFMLKRNIWDFRNIPDKEEHNEEFLQEFSHNSDLLNIYKVDIDSYSFYLPDDLIDSLRDNIVNGVTLVGGGRKECLREVAILLDILDIKYNINESLTY